MKLRLLLSALLVFVALKSNAQTFNCYVANDAIIAPNTYKFDVYIEATSSDFYFRSIQLGIHFNQQLFNSNAIVTGSLVPNTTDLYAYLPGTLQWNYPSSSLSVTASMQNNCYQIPNSIDHDLIAVGEPRRISSYIISSDSAFNCTQPDITMILIADTFPFGVLRMAVSKWDSTCLAVSITSLGTYTHVPTNSLYQFVNNPVNPFCFTSISEMENEFKVYPNPTNEKIFIECSNGFNDVVKLYNYTGKLIKVFDTAAYTNVIAIDFSEFPQGMYVLKIGDSKGKIVVKE